MKFKDLGIKTYNKEIFKVGSIVEVTIDEANISDDNLAIYMHKLMNKELDRNYLVYVKRADNFDSDLVITDKEGYFAIEKDKVVERVDLMMLRLGIMGIAGFIENNQFNNVTKFDVIKE